jgi:hypothetical protein
MCSTSGREFTHSHLGEILWPVARANNLLTDIVYRYMQPEPVASIRLRELGDIREMNRGRWAGGGDDDVSPCGCQRRGASGCAVPGGDDRHTVVDQPSWKAKRCNLG